MTKGEGAAVTTFEQKVDDMLYRNKPSSVVTIECGSWRSLYEYIIEDDRPTPKQVTDFSDYAKNSTRFRCLQTGSGIVRVEIRKNDACKF